MSGLSVTVCSLRQVFKYISINKTMTQLSSTLGRCAKDILGFAVMFFIVFFAYAQLGYLLFGTEVESFSTFTKCMYGDPNSCSARKALKPPFNPPLISTASRSSGLSSETLITTPSTAPTEFSARSILSPTCSLCSLFYWLVMLLYNMFDFSIYFLNKWAFIFIFHVSFPQNMFLAIINDTYTEVKEELSSQKDELQITDIIKQVRSRARVKLPREADTYWALSTELHEDDYKA